MSALKEVKVEPEVACISAEEFKQGMSAFPGAVNIVTTEVGNIKVGFTATAVCSVSDNLVSLPKSRSVGSQNLS